MELALFSILNMQLVIIRETYGNMTCHGAAIFLPTTSELSGFTHLTQDGKSLPGTFWR